MNNKVELKILKLMEFRIKRQPINLISNLLICYFVYISSNNHSVKSSYCNKLNREIDCQCLQSIKGLLNRDINLCANYHWINLRQTRFQQLSVSYTDSIRTADNRIKFWPRAILEHWVRSHWHTRACDVARQSGRGVRLIYKQSICERARAQVYAKHTHKSGFRVLYNTHAARQLINVAAANSSSRAMRIYIPGSLSVIKPCCAQENLLEVHARTTMVRCALGFKQTTRVLPSRRQEEVQFVCLFCWRTNTSLGTQCTNTAAEIACNDTNSQ